MLEVGAADGVLGCAMVLISQRKRSAPITAARSGENLDGDLALVAEVVGEIHRGHAALAELTLDGIAVAEGGGGGWGRRSSAAYRLVAGSMPARRPPRTSSGRFWSTTIRVAGLRRTITNVRPSGEMS